MRTTSEAGYWIGNRSFGEWFHFPRSPRRTTRYVANLANGLWSDDEYGYSNELRKVHAEYEALARQS